MSESSEDTVYPTAWEMATPAGGIHHHAGRSLRRKLSAYVWESRVVWPGDPLYPQNPGPSPPAPPAAIAAERPSASARPPDPDRLLVSRARYVLPSMLRDSHPRIT